MFKATLRSLVAHKLRLALTSLAIVLGVGFVAGSLVLTDTLNATFVRLFKEVDGGVDVRVRARASFNEQDRGGNGSKYQPIPASILDDVRRVPGVRGATGVIQNFAQMVDKKGKPIGGQGPPTIGVAVSQDPQLSRATYVKGRQPAAATEVAIDKATASKHGFRVGDPIRILLTGPAQDFTVAGVFKVGSADTLAGATIAAFDVDTAQRVLDRPGAFDAVDVKSGAGSQAEVRNRLDDALGHRYDVVTGQQLVAQEAQEVTNGFVKFIGTALLIFAGVALLVGTFIISNTFSIIVASRTRELALLRALGARRGQILASVVGEALATGVVSSLVGVGFGYLVATGLKAVLAAFGGHLPSSATVLAARTFAISMVVGVLVTVLSALLPALRAMSVPPVAALREDNVVTGGELPRGRVVVGAVFLALGAVGLSVGLGGSGLALVGLGALGVLIGVAVLAVVVARPLATAIGAPLAGLFKLPGQLARENAKRNPGRTSSTAAALMIGLALVTFVTVLASSINASVADTFRRSFAADYVAVGRSFEGFSADLAPELRRVPELGSVAVLASGQWRLDGRGQQLQASQLTTFARLFRVKLSAGRLPPDDGSGLLVVKETARSHHWKVGDRVPMQFARTGVQQVRIAGIFERSDFASKYLLAYEDFSANFGSRQAQAVAVKAAPGVPAATSKAAMLPVLARYPNVELKDQAQYKQTVTSKINQIQALISVLLLLAIVIAVIGIVNTLALSVLERTRELGLLRAVGMSRRQTRRMIRWEAVIIAVIGAVLGLAVGVFFGWAVVRAIRDQGINVLRVPGGQLAAYVVMSAILGVAAAIFPARRAARLDVLAAIAHE